MKIRFLIKFATLFILSGCSDKKPGVQRSDFIHNKNMSSTVLKIIPTAPSFVPTRLQQEHVQLFLAKLYSIDKIELAITSEIEFVDQGQNFASVMCNLCGHEIPIESWQTAMDNANENCFENLVFITPCCDNRTSLNDLTYVTPAGFAKFIITIEDAQNDIGRNELNELEHILGLPLRLVWAHY